MFNGILAWLYWTHIPEMLLRTCQEPWKWRLLVEANTTDARLGSVSNPVGSTHWFVSVLRAATPDYTKTTDTIAIKMYLVIAYVHKLLTYSTNINWNVSINYPNIKNTVSGNPISVLRRVLFKIQVFLLYIGVSFYKLMMNINSDCGFYA